jgi:hypothetical protein
MPLKYSQNKIHIYNWRENNPDHYKLVKKLWKRKNDAWIRIQKIYLNILLD